MATLREWLNEAGFDWNNGVIIAHTITEGSYSPGWGDSELAYKFDFRGNTLPDTQANILLDTEFVDGYGSPQAPKIIAKDKDKIYFPVQYDGSTWLDWVYIDIEKYMDVENETPYPGG
jgi:hypothetical protein